jgi:biopolymer transport protein ExbB
MNMRFFAAKCMRAAAVMLTISFSGWSLSAPAVAQQMDVSQTRFQTSGSAYGDVAFSNGRLFAQLAPASPSSPAPAFTPAPVASSPRSPTAAPAGPVDTTDKPRALATIPRELSPWSMFLSADILVKVVMISLGFASLVTWTILLGKSVQLSLARRRLRNALAGIAQTRTLSEAQLALGRRNNPVSWLLAAAILEVRISEGATGGIQARAASRFAEIVRTEVRSARVGMAILATIGATSPFVGLFGTVWGIMNSFIGISKAQTTNLAVVAPGIAEALLATAVGLAAAIPAVIIYNYFSRSTKGYQELLGRAAGAISRLLSRDLDRNHGSLLSRKVD